MTDAAAETWVRLADLRAGEDAAYFRRLLDRYAQDPLGIGVVLPAEVLEKASHDLAVLPGARVYLAGVESTPCGFATCFLGYSTFRARSLLNVHDLAVLPSRRGHGIGRALLEKITRDARQLGCCKLTLEVREDNPAVEFYRAAGFLTAQTPDGPIQYLFLEKPL